MSLSTQAPKLKVLISGAGIAGPCLAYWLSRTPLNVSVTVLERSPTPRVTGQSIDVRGSAIDILKKMQLEEALRARHTTEVGTRIVNSTGNTIAEFGKGDTFTAEYEILRADLCGLFLDATTQLPNVRYIYGNSISALTQNEKDVTVSFSRGATEQFDLLVAADGSTSHTRPMILSPELLTNCYNFIGQYVAYFSIPQQSSDTKHWYWYNAPRGLGLMLRPHRNTTTVGCYMCVTTPAHGKRDEGIEKALNIGPEAQKQILAEYFAGAGWQAERIVAGMHEAEDFYMSRAAQVKLPSWHSGRSVLIGDAAFATFGIGTSLAIESAYVLAGELGRIKESSEVAKALDAYESTFRKRYSKSEDLPPGFPQLAFPQTGWGLKVRDLGLWLVSKTKAYKLLPADDGVAAELPAYEWQEA